MSGKSFAAVMGVMGVIALLAFGLLTKGEDVLAVGEEAPVEELDVLAASEEGKETLTIADYRGQWVLLNVWASWCGPCKAEAPDLTAFQRDHGGRDFTVLGIQTQDGTDDGLEFAREYELNYPSLRDGSGDYADDLGATGVPESLLLDPEGRVAWAYPGQIDAERLKREVLPLIEGDGGGAGA